MKIELIIAISAVLILTLVYGVCLLRNMRALAETKKNRNAIYRACFLRGLSGILAKIASADGKVDESEIKVADALFVSMGLTPEDRAICSESFRIAANSDLKISYYASLFAPYSTHEVRVMVYEVLWDIAAADGKLKPGEEEVLRSMISWLDLDPSQYDCNAKAHTDRFVDRNSVLQNAGQKIEQIVEKE